MKPKDIDESAFMDDAYCKDCGWPIVKAMCNDEFQNFKNADEEDYWVYCSNKGCKNHDGVGVYYKWPEWYISNPKIINPSDFHIKVAGRMIENISSIEYKEAINISNLEADLIEALQNEDYEKAALLRDEIQKLKNKK